MFNAKFVFVDSLFSQLIATATLFLAAKSEETPRPLNDVLRASCEITHKQDLTFLSYLFPVVSTFTSESPMQSYIQRESKIQTR